MSEVLWLDEIPDDERRMIAPDVPRRFRVLDTEYVTTLGSGATSDLCIKKPPGLVDLTVEFLSDYRRASIVELGISTRWGPGPDRPDRRTEEAGRARAVRGSRRAARALHRRHRPPIDRPPLLRNRSVGPAVVRQIIDDEFGSEPLDLVTDDASHLLDLTRISFETLFPRIRPGGVFIIEDWNCDHLRAEAVAEALATEDSPGRQAFNDQLKERLADRSSTECTRRSRLGSRSRQRILKAHPFLACPRVPSRSCTMELLAARAWSGDVVSELIINDYWVIVVRGPATLDLDSFRVANMVHDRFALIPRGSGSLRSASRGSWLPPRLPSTRSSRKPAAGAVLLGRKWGWTVIVTLGLAWPRRPTSANRKVRR